MSAPDTRALEAKAKAIRLEVLEAAARANKGHLGGTYSCVDLLTALYYGGGLKFNPREPQDPNRDRFILSKGHACLALYSIFKDFGMLSEAVFESYGQDGGLGGQLEITTPGVDFNTGSLGHAIGVGSGMALAAKMDGRPSRAFVMVGDAELFEGSMWEAIMFASEKNLSNLVVIIDRNRLSVTAALEDDSVFRSFREKTTSFGWEFYEIDGHNFAEIHATFAALAAATRPVMIVANTVKGKGVSFLEGSMQWHSGVPGEAELAIARRELAG